MRDLEQLQAGPESHPGSGILRIGNWVVEPSLSRLVAHGKCVSVEPRWMALLCHLAARPGEVVSREALLSAVWPAVVVGDDSLTQAVAKLRKALGDSPAAPEYIETISKRGYRLVAPVSRVASIPARSRRRPPATAVITGTALLVAAVAWWSTFHRGDVEAQKSPAPGLHSPASAQPTVTIAPFNAQGNDSSTTLLAQGITADLITDLMKLSGLSVIADARYPGSADGPVADHGGPGRYLVSGTVQSEADRVRLHVLLTDTETGKPLWSERFESEPSGLFAMQDDMSRKILRVLPAKVTSAEMRRMAHRHTRSLEAYEYFQRGQAELVVRRKSENEAARKLFSKAIALDPAFARAYASLALTYAADYRNQWDGEAALDRAFELARTAHELHPDVRETYWVLGMVLRDRHRHDEAMRYLKTAIALYPSYADAYALMGSIKIYTGQPAEALPLLLTAMRLNPEGNNLYRLNIGRAYFALGNIEQAREHFEQVLFRNASNLDAHVYMAVVHSALGDKAAAAWEAEEIRALRPRFSGRQWLQTHPLTDTTHKETLLLALGNLGL